MEKIFYYVLGIIFLVVVAIVFVFVGLGAQAQQEQPKGLAEFATLCTIWRSRGCTESALADINATQQLLGEQTLTELCISIFLAPTQQESIIMCQDVCMNRCYTKLWYDFAVSEDDINRTSSDKVNITIHNKGTATANVTIEIWNSTQKIKEDKLKLFRPGTSRLIEQALQPDKWIRVFIDPAKEIDEIDEGNNMASRKFK